MEPWPPWPPPATLGICKHSRLVLRGKLSLLLPLLVPTLTPAAASAAPPPEDTPPPPPGVADSGLRPVVDAPECAGEITPSAGDARGWPIGNAALTAAAPAIRMRCVSNRKAAGGSRWCEEREEPVGDSVGLPSLLLRGGSVGEPPDSRAPEPSCHDTRWLLLDGTCMTWAASAGRGMKWSRAARIQGGVSGLLRGARWHDVPAAGI